MAEIDKNELDRKKNQKFKERVREEDPGPHISKLRGDRRIAVDLYFVLLRDCVDRLPTVIVKFMYLLFPDISKIIFQSYSSTMNVH